MASLPSINTTTLSSSTWVTCTGPLCSVGEVEVRGPALRHSPCSLAPAAFPHRWAKPWSSERPARSWVSQRVYRLPPRPASPPRPPRSQLCSPVLISPSQQESAPKRTVWKSTDLGGLPGLTPMHTAGSSAPGPVSSANTGKGVGSGNRTCCGAREEQAQRRLVRGGEGGTLKDMGLSRGRCQS